jgi:hypothetical protein
MARVACLVLAAEGDVVLGRAAADMGWATLSGAALVAAAALLTAAGVWVSARLSVAHLVVDADAGGVVLGPSLGQILRPGHPPSTSRTVPWSSISRIQVLVREARMTGSGREVRQRQLRVTTHDGWWIARALPTDTDLAALARAIRSNEPALRLEVSDEAYADR